MTTKKIQNYSEILKKKYGRISFGKFLISWRTAENLSQKDFALKIGLSAANLCDLEQERRIPTPTRAKKIAKKLGIPEKGLLILAIEDKLHHEGLHYTVELKEVA